MRAGYPDRMVKPQQPELARSGKGATSDDAVKSFLTAPDKGAGERGIGGPIPEDNLPGHHPAEEQDKPVDAFVAKAQALAAEAAAADRADVEVVALRPAGDEQPSALADKAAELAGTPFRVAGDVLQKVRDRL